MLSDDVKLRDASLRTLAQRQLEWVEPWQCLWCRDNLAFVLRFKGTLYERRYRPGDLLKGFGKVVETCGCGYQVFKSELFAEIRASLIPKS